MRPAVRALCLCLVALLAGCNAPVGGDTRPDTPVRTATAAPVPEDATLAPGLTDEGVVAPATLARAHTESLRNRSYTLAANQTARYANGTVRSGLRIRVALGADRSYATRTSTVGPEGPVFLGEPPATAGFWANGSVYVRRLARENTTVYNEFRPNDDGAGTWSYWVATVPFGGGQADPTSFYGAVFRSVAIESVERTTAGGTTAYRLRGSRLRSSPAFADDLSDVRDVRLTATVTERGLVRSLRLRYTGTVDGATVRVDWRVRYRQVGSTTVERPPWFERAVQ